MTQEAIIQVRSLRNSFGDQVIHDNLDLDVRRGEILGVVGGSGSTLIVICAGLVKTVDARSPLILH